MSLVGNLEDLGLVDIMQIISLSQKSGILELTGDEGSGRIAFQSGLVQAAYVKGRPSDLREVLVGGGFVEVAEFDEWAARALELGVPIEESIVRGGGPSTERIDSLIRQTVEAAVLEMLSWQSGDFLFEVRSKLEPDDPQLRLSTGINAQYLAMEGMRVRDDRSREESAADVVAAAVVSGENELPFEDDAARAASPPAITTESQSEAVSESALPSPAACTTPAVLIDADVSVLEWVKTTVQDDFSRVHVFQQAELGLARIRQYLIRGELPVVLISITTRIDLLSGIRGLADYVRRLKTQAERLVVIGLREADSQSDSAIPAGLDGMLIRPTSVQLCEGLTGDTQTIAQDLVSELGRILADRSVGRGADAAKSSETKSAGVRDLRHATARLKEASSRGDVLPVVLDFASELFLRVAILIVREDAVFAIAGRGIDSLKVDPLAAGSEISFQTSDQGWIRTVLQSGEACQGPPTTAADHELLTQFGGVEPAAAYLGTIDSGGSAIALLYGDQAASGAEMPDTNGLEVVLHHAGLALERAALERELREADAE